MNLAEKLSQLIKNSGRSAAWVAKQAGISKGYLWQLMNEPNKEPSGVKLLALGRALGVTVDELLNDNELVFRPTNRRVMACARCNTTQDLILLPHKGGDAIHGLLISCVRCKEYICGSRLNIDFRWTKTDQ